MAKVSDLSAKLILVAKGFAMGVADIIPGVSGGTIAFVSGIYEQLIAAINSVRPTYAISFLKLLIFLPNREKRQEQLRQLSLIHWGFILPLATGIISAVLIMARIIPPLMQSYPFYMYSLFFGLIVFSVPIVFKNMTRDISSYLVLGAFAILMYLAMGPLRGFEGSTALAYVFLSGAIAICAMVLPGISGSYILVLLGQYVIVLDALHTRDLVLLSVFIAGIGVGLLSFARLLRYLLNSYHSATMAALTGIMIGGLRVIWPGNYAPSHLSAGSIATAVVAALFGGVLINTLNRLSGHKKLDIS